jgi:hypothetical protein
VKILLNDAVALKATLSEQIVKRLQENAGDTPKTRDVIAAKKLSSGDIILHVNDVIDKARLQASTEWTARLCPSAKVYIRTFTVLIYGVSTAGRARFDSS